MSDDKYRPTVMPKDESLERQDNHLGGPGIQLPKNAENISAFKEVSDVDAKELNARINLQRAAQNGENHPTNTPGIHIPKDAENISAFKEITDETPDQLKAKLNK